MGCGSGHLTDDGMVTVARSRLQSRDRGRDMRRGRAAVPFDGGLVEERGRRGHDVGGHGQLVVVAVVGEHGGGGGRSSGGVTPGRVGAGAGVRRQLGRDGRGSELVRRSREGGRIPR